MMSDKLFKLGGRQNLYCTSVYLANQKNFLYCGASLFTKVLLFLGRCTPSGACLVGRTLHLLAVSYCLCKLHVHIVVASDSPAVKTNYLYAALQTLHMFGTASFPIMKPLHKI